jgi:hypothetical protein
MTENTAETEKQPAKDTKADDSNAKAPLASGGKVIFAKNFEIDFSKEIPHYNNDYCKAYVTKGINGDDGAYFTLVTTPAMTPRTSKAATYARINGGPMAFLMGSGVVPVPGKGEQYCFIYRDNLGDKAFKASEKVTKGWKAERVLEKIVTPVITVLKDMHEVDLTHGNIRLDNFYTGGKENYDHILIGDCLSTAPSVLQPAIYEPLHRCTAQPSGRGPGLIEDDLYALGVCIALLMRTRDPMAKASEEEIILNKIQHGTYSTLIHKDDRFTGAVLELLRGLLIDDQRQRWNMADVLAWLDGRRLSPKQSSRRKRASRALTYRNQGYHYMEAFANDVFKKPAESVQLIESEEIEQWLMRSVEDKNAAARLETAILSAAETGKTSGYWDRLLSRVAIALDPEGPIRYKDLSVRAEGLGIALAEGFVKNMNLQSFLEIFNSPLLQYWLVTCTDMNLDVSVYVSRFESCKDFIKRPLIGYGLERVLYFLNPESNCLSPLLANYHVKTAEDLLLAFEKLAQEKKRPSLMFDRHIAAFLSVKDSKVIDSYLYDLNSPEPHRKLVGIINSLYMIQKTQNVGLLPNLTQWICDSLVPIINRYHDKEKREELKKKLKKVASSGDLSKVVFTVDDQDTIKRDFAAFKVALHEYKTLEREHKILSADLDHPENYGKIKGRQTAVIVSGVISSLITMAFIIMHMNGTNPFFNN